MTTFCADPECVKDVHARGLCSNHYFQHRHDGTLADYPLLTPEGGWVCECGDGYEPYGSHKQDPVEGSATMIKKSQTNLPRGNTDSGRPPDAEPRFVTALADAWLVAYEKAGGIDKPTALGTILRVSDAGSCARALGYQIRRRKGEDVAPSNPHTVADYWRFGLGTMVHEHLQAVLPLAFPGAGIEIVVDLRGEGIDCSGHIDVVIDTPIERADTIHDDLPTFWRTVLELKSINGFGMKNAATTFNGPPEGPRSSAVTQGALLASAHDADELVIGYLALENLSPDVAARHGLGEVGRFAAEWTYGRDEFEPIAAAERARFAVIADAVAEGILPPRSIPDLPTGATVTDPKSGSWAVLVDGAPVDVGKTWHCAGYCEWRDTCIQDGA